MHPVDEERLRAVHNAMVALEEAINALYEDQCGVVLAIHRPISDHNYDITVMTKLDPELAAPILWHALGDTQAIIKASRPPSDSIN